MFHVKQGTNMHRNQSAHTQNFAMIPQSDVPRSTLNRQHTHKTTFNSGLLIPMYVEEILPGDKFKVNMTCFARLATPLFPIMDNMYLDSFFFFVPNRLIWANWQKMMGQQDNPGDSISYIMPTITSPVAGYLPLTLYDYMGLPTVGQMGGANTYTHIALPMRAYNLIWNQWFRDENLQNSIPVNTADGPDTYTDYILKRRGKRHDYFTASLPWPQKGNTAVSLPLGTTAPVKSNGVNIQWSSSGGGVTDRNVTMEVANAIKYSGGAVASTASVQWGTNTGLFADLSTATAATINQIRQAFTLQQFLEKDARGGTRYTEILRSHFGVISPDARLQRPEYLGGGSTPININPIAQTGPTGTTGSTTPMGQLAAMGTALAQGHGFTQSFVEHGYVIGLVAVRADLTYQQGVRKMWNRSTRYDFYWPVFANLGEQAVLNKEIYADGSANDNNVWGYQERWSEYRYNPNRISGLFKSTTANTIDPWHLAQKFTTLPTLNDTFIQDTPPVSRVIAVPAQSTNGAEFIVDTLFTERCTRPMPIYSVPGLRKL